MGILSYMRRNRHITGYRNEGAGFHVGLVVVVNSSSHCGAHYGFTGSLFSGFVNFFYGKNITIFASKMRCGLRMPRQWKKSIVSGTKLPWTWFVQRNYQCCVKKRQSCYHTRFRPRNCNSSQESGLDFKWNRKNRIRRVPCYNVPRTSQLR